MQLFVGVYKSDDCDLLNETNWKHFKNLGALCEGALALFSAMTNFKIYNIEKILSSVTEGT